MPRPWRSLRVAGLVLGLLASDAGCNRPASEPAEASAAPSASLAPAVTAGATASAPPAPPPEPEPSPRIHLNRDGAIEVVDMHVDTPWRVHFKGRDKSLTEGHATPELLRKGDVAALVYPIYIPDYINDDNPRIADAEAIFDTIDAIVAEHEELQLAVGPGSIKERRGLAVPEDRVGVFVAIEGAGAFAEDVSQIDRFIARGVRLVGPVHARDNDLATSATGKKGGYGLTDKGKKLCRRVYEAGGLIDVSHMSDEAFEDLVPIAAEYDAPIVATHSNARKLRGSKRNLTDAQLKIIAETGGVAGLNLHHRFVRGGQPRMKHVVAMVRHMVDVAGVDHVAIGTDFEGGNPVEPVSDASELPDLAEALVASGMDTEDVRKIFGKNALRILYWKIR